MLQYLQLGLKFLGTTLLSILAINYTNVQVTPSATLVSTSLFSIPIRRHQASKLANWFWMQRLRCQQRLIFLTRFVGYYIRGKKKKGKETLLGSKDLDPMVL